MGVPEHPTFLLFSVMRMLLSLVLDKINASLAHAVLYRRLVLPKHNPRIPLVTFALYNLPARIIAYATPILQSLKATLLCKHIVSIAFAVQHEYYDRISSGMFL